MADPAKRRRVLVTLAILALMAALLYGATLMRFGAMMAERG